MQKIITLVFLDTKETWNHY